MNGGNKMSGKITVDYKEYAKKMRAAKTAKEMTDSWAYAVPPGTQRDEFWAYGDQIIGVYVDKAPEIIKYFGQEPMLSSLEKEDGLDPKTKELILVAAIAGMKEGRGMVKHILAAMAQGATEAEILDTIHLVIYEHGKTALTTFGPALKTAFEQYKASK